MFGLESKQAKNGPFTPKPLVKIYTLNSEQSKQIFTNPLSFFDEVCILTKMKTWGSSSSSLLKHFLASIPMSTSYKITYPWSKETMKFDQVWLLLPSDAFVINILVWFFLYLVRYSEEKDEGWQLQSVHSVTRMMWPFVLVHSVWSKPLLQVTQPEKEVLQVQTSYGIMVRNVHPWATYAWIIIRTFLSYHISNRHGKILHPSWGR